MIVATSGAAGATHEARSISTLGSHILCPAARHQTKVVGATSGDPEMRLFPDFRDALSMSSCG
jgi:hypothetical protein